MKCVYFWKGQLYSFLHKSSKTFLLKEMKCTQDFLSQKVIKVPSSCPIVPPKSSKWPYFRALSQMYVYVSHPDKVSLTVSTILKVSSYTTFCKSTFELFLPADLHYIQNFLQCFDSIMDYMGMKTVPRVVETKLLWIGSEVLYNRRKEFDRCS